MVGFFEYVLNAFELWYETYEPFKVVLIDHDYTQTTVAPNWEFFVISNRFTGGGLNIAATKFYAINSCWSINVVVNIKKKLATIRMYP